MLGAQNNPTPVPDIGLVVPYPPDLISGVIAADNNGRFSAPVPSFGPQTVYCQWVVLDPANPGPFVLSNAVRLVMP